MADPLLEFRVHYTRFGQRPDRGMRSNAPT